MVRAVRSSIGVLAASAAVTLLLGACSSSSSSSSSPASTSSASTSASASGSGSSQVAAAQQATAKWSQAPTTIPLTTPLNSKPPAGKTFVWLKCDISQCKDEQDGLAAATAAIGWNLKVIDYQSANPATLVAAMKQALTYHPVAVAFSGLPEAVWSGEIPEYKAANVPLVAGYLGPTPITFPLIANIGGPADVSQYGQIIANWFIADSNGKGKALSVRVDDFPILKVYSDSFASTVANGCSGCSIVNLPLSIPTVTSGGSVQAIVAALQRDRSINYLITSNGPFIDGLPSALAAAGLSGKVKVAGESGDVENLTDVKTGKEQAFTGLALHYGAWLMVDAVLRHMQGLSFGEADGGLPKQLLTNTATFAIANSFDEPTNYAAQFKTLWKV